MPKLKKTDALILEVSSAEDLKLQLAGLARSSGSKPPVFIHLLLNDPQLVVRSFQIQGVTLKELGPCLHFEAVELLSLPLKEIELDYQILSQKDNTFNGVFICLPKKNLAEYLRVLDQARFTPVQLSARSLVFMDQFLSHERSVEQRRCLLEFDRGSYVYLGVFSQDRCELLRVFASDKTEEIQEEIIVSLRSVLGKSRDKTISQIICQGDIPQKENLFFAINQKFGVFAESASSGFDPKTPMTFFRLNLLKNYFLSLPERKRRDFVLNGLTGALMTFVLVLGILIVRDTLLFSQTTSFYKSADLDYARKLERKLKVIQNAK